MLIQYDRKYLSLNVLKTNFSTVIRIVGKNLILLFSGENKRIESFLFLFKEKKN